MSFFNMRIGFVWILSMILWTVSSSEAPKRCFIDTVWGATDVHVDRDVQYGSAYNNYTKKLENLYLDIYTPPKTDQREKRPGMVLIHGGSFVGGDKSNEGLSQLAIAFVQRGFVVTSINYRLTGKFWGVVSPPGECCPGTTSDQYARDASHDLKAAVRYMRKMASDLHVDVDRVGVAGGSAGAVTVLFTAYVSSVGEGNSGNPNYGSQVSVAIPVSGELRYDAFCKGFDDSGVPYGCVYGVWNEINAINSTQQPPLCMVHGTDDLVVPILEARSLQTRAKEVGLESELIEILGAGHVPYAQLLKNSTYLIDLMTFIVDAMKLKEVPSECPKA